MRYEVLRISYSFQENTKQKKVKNFSLNFFFGGLENLVFRISRIFLLRWKTTLTLPESPLVLEQITDETFELLYNNLNHLCERVSACTALCTFRI